MRTSRLRGILSAVCSTLTMDRLVDPILSDIETEPGRPRWRGYLALARALCVHAALNVPGAATRLWTDDRHALPRAIAAWALTTLILTMALMAIPLSQWVGPWKTMLLLLPQGLALALPASLFVAIPLSFRDTTDPRRLIGRGLQVSILCAAATFVLITRVLPETNQAFRVDLVRRVAPPVVQLERGPNEMSLRELRSRIEVLSLTPGGARAGRRLEQLYQFRLALGVIALPLGLISTAIALSALGRRRPVLTGGCGMAVYALLFVPVQLLTLSLIVRFERVPVAAVVWLPVVALMIAAAVAVQQTTRRWRATSA